MIKENRRIIIAVVSVILVCALAAGIVWIAKKKSAPAEQLNANQQSIQANDINSPEGKNTGESVVKTADDAASAYKLAVECGFEGNEEQWAASVKEKIGETSAAINGAYVNEQSHLIVTLDDGTETDTGYVNFNEKSPTDYTVVFSDYDGTVLKTQTVAKGENATAPVNPEREGYIFTGWDNTFINVQDNISVTAQYVENSDGPVIFVDSVNSSAGKTVKLKAVIKNNPGILGTSMVVNYDSSVLTLKKAVAGEAFSALNLTKPATFRDGCIFPAYAESLKDGDVKDGTVLELTFEISDSAKSGSYLVSVSCPEGDTYDIDSKVISVTASPGSVTVA